MTQRTANSIRLPAVIVAPLAAFDDTAAFAHGCLAAFGLRGTYERPSDGPPVLIGSDLYVSAAHSRSLRALALDHTPIGVDAELLRPCDFSRIAQRFSPVEQRYLSTADPRAFFRLWCAKEAYAKQSGKPLLSVLSEDSLIVDGPVSQYNSLRFDYFEVEQNALAVCSHGGGATLYIPHAGGCQPADA